MNTHTILAAATTVLLEFIPHVICLESRHGPITALYGDSSANYKTQEMFWQQISDVRWAMRELSITLIVPAQAAFIIKRRSAPCHWLNGLRIVQWLVRIGLCWNGDKRAFLFRIEFCLVIHSKVIFVNKFTGNKPSKSKFELFIKVLPIAFSSQASNMKLYTTAGFR